MGIFPCFYRSFSRLVDTLKVPGLHLFENFLGTQQSSELAELSLAFFSQLQQSAGDSQRARTHLSKQHNLSTREEFETISLNDGDVAIEGELFRSYGDTAHQLGYFRGTKNIPEWLWQQLVTKVRKVEAVQQLGSQHNWKFTWNAYRCAQSSEQPTGFPWHVDIPGNGDITSIYTLGQSARISLRNTKDKSQMVSHMLPSDSLVLLSGEARWEWEHMVELLEPGELASPSLMDLELCAKLQDVGLKRIALVLGARNLKQAAPAEAERIEQIFQGDRSFFDLNSEERRLVDRYS